MHKSLSLLLIIYYCLSIANLNNPSYQNGSGRPSTGPPVTRAWLSRWFFLLTRPYPNILNVLSYVSRQMYTRFRMCGIII